MKLFLQRWSNTRNSHHASSREKHSNAVTEANFHDRFSLVCVNRSSSRAEPINRILDAAGQIRNGQDMVLRAEAQTCVDNQGGDFENARCT
jgi:hypothetical protein